jgi:hypothetical protein
VGRDGALWVLVPTGQRASGEWIDDTLAARVREKGLLGRTPLFAMLHNGKVAVIVAPFVARRLAGEGWSKDDVRRHLHTEGRLPTDAWRRSWLRATVHPRGWPAWVGEAAGTGAIPVVREPADITVLVAGADLAIPQLAYFPSWGHPPCRVTREVEMPPDWRERLTRVPGR